MKTNPTFVRNNLANVDALAVLKRFDAIVPFLNLDGAGQASRRRGPCPSCGGTDRFLFDNKGNQGTYYCQSCGAGNWFKLIRMVTGMTDREIFLAIDDAAQVSTVYQTASAAPTLETQNEEADKARAVLKSCWESGSDITEKTAAGKYLLRRVPGLDLSRLGVCLRSHKNMKFIDTDAGENKAAGYWPVMMAKVKDSACVPVTLHRTYLSNDGQKAPFAKVKKLMKGVRKLQGASIRLNKVASRTLVITEGIETGLAVLVAHQYSVSVWSLISAGNMAVADIPRAMFDRVVIYADHDMMDEAKGYRPGEHYAKQLKSKLLAEGFDCHIVVPEKEGDDFADMWERGAPFLITG
jgi:putative DNA primase/helicase